MEYGFFTVAQNSETAMFEVTHKDTGDLWAIVPNPLKLPEILRAFNSYLYAKEAAKYLTF